MFGDNIFGTIPFSTYEEESSPVADTNYWNKVCIAQADWTKLEKDEKDYRSCNDGT